MEMEVIRDLKSDRMFIRRDVLFVKRICSRNEKRKER